MTAIINAIALATIAEYLSLRSAILSLSFLSEEGRNVVDPSEVEDIVLPESLFEQADQIAHGRGDWWSGLGSVVDAVALADGFVLTGEAQGAYASSIRFGNVEAHSPEFAVRLAILGLRYAQAEILRELPERIAEAEADRAWQEEQEALRLAS